MCPPDGLTNKEHESRNDSNEKSVIGFEQKDEKKSEKGDESVGARHTIHLA